MKNLLAYTPETFDNLELENFEYAPLVNEMDMEEGFVRGKQSRPRTARVKTMPRRSIASVLRKPSKIPRLPQIPPRQPMRPLLPPPRIGSAASVNVFPPTDDRRPSGQSSSSGNAGGEGSFVNAPAQDVSSEHVRWVQETLNRALGLRLIVDGIMNRETRSAVRMFQERKGLSITGLVGPDTEEALRAEGGQAAAEPELLEGEWEMEHSVDCLWPSCRRNAAEKLAFEPEASITKEINFAFLERVNNPLEMMIGKSLKIKKTGASSVTKVKKIPPGVGKEPTRIKPSNITAKPKGKGMGALSVGIYDDFNNLSHGLSVRKAFPRAPQHHLIPQTLLKNEKIRENLKNKDIDIHKFAINISDGDHSGIHSIRDSSGKNYIDTWKAFFDRKKHKASKSEIMKFMNYIRRKYKIPFNIYPPVPYTKKS